MWPNEASLLAFDYTIVGALITRDASSRVVHYQERLFRDTIHVF